MPIIYLATRQIEFDHALISVPADGSDWDWMCESWVVVNNEVDIVQKLDCAVVTCRTGYSMEVKENLFIEIDPPIFSMADLLVHIVNTVMSELKREKEVIRQAIDIGVYDWGSVVTLQWHRLGYAPGGGENYVLPINGAAIHIGFVQFDWAEFRCPPKS